MGGRRDARSPATHYRLEQPHEQPGRRSSRPHPPILIGGTGEKRTLPLVARYADACNVFDIPDGGATVRHKLGVLRGLCDEIGRPYEEIEKTIATRLEPDETAASFVERCSAFVELGIDHVGVITTGPWTDAAVATLAEAVPEIATLNRGPQVRWSKSPRTHAMCRSAERRTTPAASVGITLSKLP